MPLSVKNFNYNSAASSNAVHFTGIKTGKFSNLKTLKNISKLRLDGIYQTLENKIAPGFIQQNGSNFFYKKANSFLDALKYPFTKMPLEILNGIANKFDIPSLKNSNLLAKFRQNAETEKYERAFRGLIQNGSAFIEKNGTNADKIEDGFYKLFNENLAPEKAKYNTTHERTIVRFVSGFTAAAILGNDFYNKSIMNGKTDAEAKKEAKSKRNQEIIENTQEAITQYFTLSAASGFVNNSTFGAPVLNTVLSLVSRITSRLSTGRPLTRIKPENIAKAPLKTLSVEEFSDAVKNNKPVEFKDREFIQNKGEDKKHILSFKNILLVCLTSIGTGFAFKGIKNTKAFNDVKDLVLNLKPVNNALQKYHNATIRKIYLNNDEMQDFTEALRKSGHKNMAKYYSNKQQTLTPNKDRKFFIGEYEKFTKIPLLNIEISNKELYTLPLAPFKIAKEIIGYPYKLANNLLQGLGLIKKDEKKLKNDINLINTYLDFKKQAAKFNNKTDSKEFLEHYAKHIDENWYSALNKETKSNVNNCDIGKLTALLGVFTSIYFSTTDDYNATLKQTGDIEKANKDARLRGVNKIIRTAVQCVFLGLNNLFKIPYSKSLLGAGIITAGCTILTDSVSRILSGMPFRKMNKEQLEEYNKNKKEGALKWYYNALDKLTD